MYIGLCCACGAVLGLITVYFWSLHIVLLAVYSAFLLSVVVFTVQEDFIININTRLIVSIITVTFFVLLHRPFEYVVVILSLTFIGSYMFMLGVDMIAHKGFYQALVIGLNMTDVCNPEPTLHKYKITKEILMMMISTLVIFIATFVLNLFLHKGKRYGLGIVANSNNTLEVKKKKEKKKDKK
ncbi:hypothetical protein BDB01DRAFT_769703 [Pilobolus umbonatus]|nr:hypothetical protein BDB01DRAFT_769703 [Pilobolus umbonatus]